MNIDDHIFEQFQAYLDGSMNQSDKELFEKGLNDSEALKNQFNEFINLDQLVIHHELLALNQRVKAYEYKPKNGFSKSKWVISSIIIGLGVWGIAGFFTKKPEQSPSKLATPSVHTIDAKKEPQLDLDAKPPIIIKNKKTEAVAINTAPSKSSSKIQREPVKRTATSNPDTELKPTISDIKIEEAEEVTHSRISIENFGNLETQRGEDHIEIEASFKNKHAEVVTPAIKNDCPTDRFPEFIDRPQTQASDVDLANGSILIGRVKGGSGNYLFRLNDGEPQETPTFSYLKQGVYSLTLIDEAGCQGEQLSIVIKPKVTAETCNFTISNESPYIFPEDGKIMNQDGEILITDQNNRVIYRKPLPAYETFSWNGTTQDGRLIEMGNSYHFIYKSDDELEHSHCILSIIH